MFLPFFQRLSIPGPTLNEYPQLNNCLKNTEHSTYKEAKLILSNDVEPNPGPKAYSKKKIKCLQSLTVIMLLVIILFKMKQELRLKVGEHNNNQNDINIISQMLKFMSKKNTSRFSFKKSTSQYMILLIILAGDVHLNPGPPVNKTEPHADESLCLRCHEENN